MSKNQAIRILIGAVVGTVIGLLITASAQQPVTVANTAVDPCADPAKVITVGVFTGSAMQRDELVAVDGTERIYLCSAWLVGSATGDFSLYFGTGTTCQTGEDLLHKETFTADLLPAEFVSGGISATAARSDTAHAFCMERHSAMTISGHYRYVQE